MSEAAVGGWQRTGRILRMALFPGLLAGGLLLAALPGRFFASLPACQFQAITGWHCPGCGGTRAFRALARGDLWGALKMNPFGTVLILAVALLALRVSLQAAWPSRRWPSLPLGDRSAWAILALLVAFTVLRNLPWWPFTLLAPG